MRIQFGGKNLPEGTHTWYDRINVDGSYGGQVNAKSGEVVEAARIGKLIGFKEDGSEDLAENAAYYVETGRAVYLDEEPTKD